MRIVIRTEAGPPIRGRVEDEDGRALAFSGWLQLLEALANLLPQHRLPGPTTDYFGSDGSA
jgi:hypothetical protein